MSYNINKLQEDAFPIRQSNQLEFPLQEINSCIHYYEAGVWLKPDDVSCENCT